MSPIEVNSSGRASRTSTPPSNLSGGSDIPLALAAGPAMSSLPAKMKAVIGPAREEFPQPGEDGMAQDGMVAQVPATEVPAAAFLLDVRDDDEWDARHAPAALHL